MNRTTTVYIKARQKIAVQNQEVYLEDIAKITCTNPILKTKLKALEIYRFPKNGPKRVVVGILKIIELIQTIQEGIEVNNIGETDIVIEYKVPSQEKKLLIGIKIVLVSCICFFGTGFTIMAFHNDIGIEQLFLRIYMLVGVEKSGGLGVLELAYSLGLGLGIIVFFNHIGGRRITKDPTPIEVEMQVYENQVNTTVIENAEEEKKEIDVS